MVLAAVAAATVAEELKEMTRGDRRQATWHGQRHALQNLSKLYGNCLCSVVRSGGATVRKNPWGSRDTVWTLG